MGRYYNPQRYYRSPTKHSKCQQLECSKPTKNFTKSKVKQTKKRSSFNKTNQTNINNNNPQEN